MVSLVKRKSQMAGNKCCIKRCRNEFALTVLGNKLCNPHFDEYCDFTEIKGNDIKKFLKKK